MRRRWRALTAATLGLLTLGACAWFEHREAGSMPPAGQRFQNNYTAFEPKGLWAVLQWRLDASRQGLPPPPQTPTPTVAPDLAFVQANARAGTAMVPAVTWIGHASALLQVAGLNLLVDPVFSERASPVSFAGPKRAQPPGLTPAQLPRIDAVLISHNHYDHLDRDSVRALAAQPGGAPLFVVPLGVKAWMAQEGIGRVVELNWWQTTTLGNAEFMLTPAQHWSGRSLTDRLTTLWGGFAILTPGFNAIYTGDTGYSKDFQDIHARLKPKLTDGRFDFAMIPVGAYEPRWFMTTQHVNPAEAVQIHRDLASRQSLGVHWGTFELTDEALDEPPKALAAARTAAGLTAQDFYVLAVGETRKLR